MLRAVDMCVTPIKVYSAFHNMNFSVIYLEVNNVVGRYWRKSHGKRRYHVNSHEASSPTPIDKEIMVEAQEE